ncbi:MAG TPA: DNA (cytosine-5-)-methyltransferase [Verrucomicrobiae bacterium]|jgi:DNA (cytosine-5)-methyltransferase 1
MNNGTPTLPEKTIQYVDLFCGIGGFRVAVEGLAKENNLSTACVLSSDIDCECQKAYEANFGEKPAGDITKVDENEVPAHDLLLAGFPCQPFSIIGHMKGFADIRGTLFFEIARILKAKAPSVFILENVKLLAGHNGGKTLKRILETLRGLGYHADYRVLNALRFGLPQKRERVFIVGFKDTGAFSRFEWCEGGVPMKPLKEVLEKRVSRKHYCSDRIRQSRWSKLKPLSEPTIWHENKAGHISAYPYSCALRAGASYNYLLVDGERRLTPREMLRLQGFPDSFQPVCSDSQTRKQAGNSVPVNLVRAVAQKVFEAQGWIKVEERNLSMHRVATLTQMNLLGKAPAYGRAKVKNSTKTRAAV